MSQLETLLPFLAVLIMSLSVHEAAHAWTADRLGDPTARMLGRLTLNPLSHIDWIGTVLFPILAAMSNLPLIGWAKPVPVNMLNLRAPRRDFAIVAVAGPISNLILATIAVLILKPMLAGGAESSLGLEILIQMALMNVMLAVFNMIPVPPLDGGNVLAGFVPESVARMLDALRPYGFIILYALMLTGVLRTISRPVQNFIFGILL